MTDDLSGLHEGLEIAEVRPMTDDELAAEGWDTAPAHARPPVVVFENGTTVYPSADPEGNGPGALFGTMHGEDVMFTGGETDEDDDPLVGKQIEHIRPMSDERLERNWWHESAVHGRPPVIVFDVATTMYPSTDPEGNGPGALFGMVDDDPVMFNAHMD